jgi:hypothetical protein
MTDKDYMKHYHFPQKITGIEARIRRVRAEAMALGYRDDAERLDAALAALVGPREVDLQKRLAAPLWG